MTKMYHPPPSCTVVVPLVVVKLRKVPKGLPRLWTLLWTLLWILKQEAVLKASADAKSLESLCCGTVER